MIIVGIMIAIPICVVALIKALSKKYASQTCMVWRVTMAPPTFILALTSVRW